MPGKYIYQINMYGNEIQISLFTQGCYVLENNSQVDKARRLRIRVVIRILPSDIRE